MKELSVGDVVALTESIAMPYFGETIEAGEIGTILDIDPEAPDNLVLVLERYHARLHNQRNLIDAKASAVQRR